MENLLMALSGIAFLMFIIGMVTPNAALFFIKNKEKRKRGMVFKIYFTAFFVFPMLSVIIYPDSTTPEQIKEEATDSKEEAQAPVVKPTPKVIEDWKYSSSIDRMTNDSIKYAYVTSNNYEEFQFPYNGGSYMDLYIRNINGKDDVYFKISKGQFMSSLGDDEYIRVSYDDSKPVTYYFSSAADGSSDIIFVNNVSAFIKRIKTAKLIKVDFPMYQEGRPVFYFSVSNLKW